MGRGWRVTRDPRSLLPVAFQAAEIATGLMLRRLMLAEGIKAPADGSDPFGILASVAGHNANLGVALDAELTGIELAAVAPQR